MTRVKIIAIGDSNLTVGLRLAGLENIITTNKKEFESNLNMILTKEEYGIVIVQEDFLVGIDWRLKKKLDNLAYPVVVPVPGLSGESAEGEDIKNMIKRALGFDIMAKE